MFSGQCPEQPRVTMYPLNSLNCLIRSPAACYLSPSMKKVRATVFLVVALSLFAPPAEAGLLECFHHLVWLARGKAMVRAAIRGHWGENVRRWGVRPSPFRTFLPASAIAQNIEDTLADQRLAPEQIIEREIALAPKLQALWLRTQQRLKSIEIRWAPEDFCLRERESIFLSPMILDSAQPGVVLLMRIEHELRHKGDRHLPDYERTFAEHGDDQEAFMAAMMQLLADGELQAVQAEIDLLPELRAIKIAYPQIFLSRVALEVWRGRGEIPNLDVDLVSLQRHRWHWQNWESDVQKGWKFYSARKPK